MDTTEKIDTKTAVIWVDAEGMVHLKMKEGAVVDLQEIEKHFDIYRQLGCDKNSTLHLFEGGAYFTFEKEAMQYASKHSKNLFVASAIVNTSLAVRLLVNLYNLFFNNTYNFKMFNSKGEALQWLRKFKKAEKFSKAIQGNEIM